MSRFELNINVKIKRLEMEKKQYVAPQLEDMDFDVEEEFLVATSFGDQPGLGGEADPNEDIPA